MPIKNYTTEIDVYRSLGEIQGAMSSLAIVASGIITVFAAPAVASWIF